MPLALIGVVIGVSAGWPGGLGASVFWLPLLAYVRIYRLGIYVDDLGVRVRGTVRTVTVPWGEVAAVESQPYRAIARPDDPRRSDCIVLVLRSGRRVRTPVRVWNPNAGAKHAGPCYDRDEIRRFMSILRAGTAA
ncbi:PH domain-containing protein [Kitasatospora sp. NPDC058965]|uniref:PH domain-containing protein n=1 Tax=Kitasatospora sp. NPDC058965 TaxID=3346682 RepID=UPI00368DB506